MSKQALRLHQFRKHQRIDARTVHIVANQCPRCTLPLSSISHTERHWLADMCGHPSTQKGPSTAHTAEVKVVHARLSLPVQAQWARRAGRWAVVWALLAQQEQSADLPVPHVVEEILEVAEHIHQERISENTPKQTVDVPVPKVKLAESSGEAGSSCPRSHDTTIAATTAVAKSVGEVLPAEFAKHGASTESELAKCSATQNVGVPVPHVVKEISGVIKDVPQERTPERTALRAPKRRNRQRNRHRS